jgi:hypothetical protein
MHSSRAILVRYFAAALIIGLLMVASASVASAHEHRDVGEYTFVVGFRVEPALVDEVNGLDLRISHGHGDSAEPVEGLHETLQAEIRYGGETMPLDLRAVYNAPGRYTADIIPTATGAYTFRVFGTINGTEVDESFTSGPETFSEVGAKDTITFPAGTIGGGGSASDAQSTADTAQTIGIIALVAGLLGLGAGIAALVMTRDSRQSGVRVDRPASDTAGD